MQFELEVKLSSTGNTITGIASPFGGKPDRDRDTVAPGAFTASLAEHKSLGTMPAMLRDHDPRKVIGVWTDLEEKPDGLHVTGTLIDPDTLTLVKAGAVRNLSIGFITKKSTPVAGSRRLDRLDLAEISLVAVPAAPGARITGIKSVGALSMSDPNLSAEPDTDDIADRMSALEDAHKGLDTRLSNVETALGKTNKGIGRLETMLRRPGAPALSSDPAEQAEIERKAFESYFRKGIERMPAEETKSLRLGDDTAGGYLAPPEYVNEIVKNIVLFSPVRSVAKVMQTGSSTVILPKRTGTPTASWVGETQARSETQSSYGRLEYQVREMAAYTDISNTMLEDSQFDIASEISSDLAEQFGKAEGAAFVAGDGINKPGGFILDPTVTTVQAVTAGSVGFSSDDIIRLFHALPTVYAQNGVFAMNRATLGAVRTFKDGAGRYMLEMTGFGPAPALTLLGRPVVEMPDMPAIASGATPIAFGDFKSGYRIIDRLQVSILRDPYAQQTSGQVRFHARRRVAGGVSKGEAIVLLKGL